MDEQELRAWTAQQLKIGNLRWEYWNLISQELREYAQNDEEERELLLSDAKRLVTAVRLTETGLDLESDDPPEQEDSRGQESIESEPGDYERERAAAYTEYRAKLAADDLGVQGFRKRNFGGETNVIAPEKAKMYLANGADLIYLNSLSRRLSKSYPWTAEQAAWFILTGEPPELAPISGRINRRWGKAYTYGTIALEVEPWISPEIVRDAYARAQKKALRRNNRRIRDRNLALFRFVLGQVESVHAYNLRELGERGMRRKRVGQRGLGPPTELRGGPPWREMMAHWNKQFPEKHAWRYKDVRNFERDFRSVEWRIGNPVKA